MAKIGPREQALRERREANLKAAAEKGPRPEPSAGLGKILEVLTGKVEVAKQKRGKLVKKKRKK